MDNQSFEKITSFRVKVPSVKVAIGRLDFVFAKCEKKKVLHLGCADEVMSSREIKKKTQLTHFMLTKIARKVWGVDISAKGIELLREMGINNLFQGDVENINKIDVLKGQNFDVILATEILEHLDNPGLFLQRVKGLFSSNTIMIITVPNAFQFTAFERGLKGYELTHPAHNFWFSYKTLYNLLVKYNYEIIEVLAYSNVDWKSSIIIRVGRKIKNNLKRIISQRKSMKQMENSIGIKDSFTKIGRTFGEVIGILVRRFLYKLNPFFADGLIFIVKPK